jgi:plastocyanin
MPEGGAAAGLVVTIVTNVSRMKGGSMTRTLKLLVFVFVIGFVLVAAAATAASTRAAAPMRITVNIFAAGNDESTLPENLAVRAGGTVHITFRNHTHMFHTFTIRSLKISVLIPPARGNGVRTASVSFVAPYGVYEWQCMLCATATHPHTHAMRGKLYAIVNT